jgi:endonuclease YncB( thermonuclease family)
MARRGPKGIWQVVLLLVAALILWGLEQRRDAASDSPSPSRPLASGGYEVFTGCRLEEHRQNDGDSFRIRLPDGRIEQFRLYFVDAPESAFRSYAGGRNNHQRISEQAVDFGISDSQAVEIGRRAKQRVRDLLAGGTFAVHTAWDDPFNDERYHAFIQPSTGPLLHETLVREGLARIHTKPADLPDGTPAKRRLAQLRDLEAVARRAKQGAWAFSGPRVLAHPGKPESDS